VGKMRAGNAGGSKGFTPHHQKATGVKPWMNEKNIPKGNTQKPQLLSRGAGFTEVMSMILVLVLRYVNSDRSVTFYVITENKTERT